MCVRQIEACVRQLRVDSYVAFRVDNEAKGETEAGLALLLHVLTHRENKVTA